MGFFWEEMKIVAPAHNEDNDTYCAGQTCQFGEGHKQECEE
jgi:hypothetical protein